MPRSGLEPMGNRECAVPGIDNPCVAGTGGNSSAQRAMGLHQIRTKQQANLPQPKHPPEIRRPLTVHIYLNHRDPQRLRLLGENCALGNRQNHIVLLPIPGGKQIQEITSCSAQIGV